MHHKPSTITEVDSSIKDDSAATHARSFLKSASRMMNSSNANRDKKEEEIMPKRPATRTGSQISKAERCRLIMANLNPDTDQESNLSQYDKHEKSLSVQKLKESLLERR